MTGDAQTQHHLKGSAGQVNLPQSHTALFLCPYQSLLPAPLSSSIPLMVSPPYTDLGITLQVAFRSVSWLPCRHSSTPGPSASPDQNYPRMDTFEGTSTARPVLRSRHKQESNPLKHQVCTALRSCALNPSTSGRFY